MAANTTLNVGASGDVIRTIDRSGSGPKTQVVQLDIGGGGGTETLVSGAMPVTGTFWQATQPVSGTVTSKTQDGSGVAITSIADGAGQVGLGISIAATNFVLSTNNSSTAQLAASATFTGVIETIFNQQCVSVLLTSDQNGTLTLNQYIDLAGTRKISAWAFTITANTPFSRNFVGNGNYFNLTFQNTGGSTTTTLNINTAYGTLPSATNLGNEPIALNEVNGSAISLGQTTMSASLPVTLASNQGAVATTPAQATPANLQMTATQALGTAGTRWFAQISDGTNSPAIKGASTAAAATDPAIVVSIAGANSATKIGDGTNNAAIKAASTAAAFTDPALTTDVRPGGALVSASAALADALANPTLGQQAVLNSVFNGTTWDRQRGMSGNLTTGDTGAKTATGNGATIANVGNKGVQIVINMGTVSGTTPTCILKMQGSADGGTTWYDIPGATTASLTATGVWGITVYPGIAVTAGTTTTGTTATANMPIPRTWRVVWTIGGTTPSFTITNIQYNYLPN